MEYDSAIKKIMGFAGKWIGLEKITLSELERQTPRALARLEFLSPRPQN